MFKKNSDLKPIGSLHVAELARKAGVTPATVRYYSRVGLISPGREPENGYRCFSSEDLHRVVFVRQAQALGLTISDITAVLETVDHGENPCHQVRSLVKQRLVSVQQKLTELRDTEVRISHAIESWQGMNGEVPANGEICPLIERLDVSKNEAARAPCPPKRHIDSGCRCPKTHEFLAASTA